MSDDNSFTWRDFHTKLSEIYWDIENNFEPEIREHNIGQAFSIIKLNKTKLLHVMNTIYSKHPEEWEKKE